jgi:hypothetical protein
MLACLATTIGVMGIFASSAQASGYPTINKTWDINAICQSFGIDCSSFIDKWQAWTNSGPDEDMLLPDGQYFFAVLDDEDADPNDGGSGNLSTSTSMGQRSFSVSGGKINNYYGSGHRYVRDWYDRNENKIQLMPFGDSSKTHSSGIYHVAICKKKSWGKYGKSDCTYHVFKCGPKDPEPPKCPKPTFGLNTSGQWTATAVFQDSGGLASIQVVDIVNATWSVSSFKVGTTQPVTLKASKINQAKASRVVVKVKDVSGNYRYCDPVLVTLKISGAAGPGGDNPATPRTFNVSARENTVAIRNGARGFSQLRVTVNGKRFLVKGLRNGQRLKLDIKSALIPNARNSVKLEGAGRSGSSATVMIS